MGNQLTAIAPSQVLPAEQYLNEFPHLEYIKSLGSTRFFKVVKARSEEGLMVVKIFVLHDSTLQLKQHEDQIEDVKRQLDLTPECKPFQEVLKSDKCVLLVRQYIQYSLYDRISTRPFLTLTEKKWIAFLLLCAVESCHKLNIYHGDIKSENVLISAWNWLVLADFATFKPVFLPHNNPADFSFYFDTSRRRTCYIAPERFMNSAYKPSEETFDTNDAGELTEEMDVFSTGCVLIELFTEGLAPFDLSQLLAFICGEYTPDKVIQNIEDKGVQQLVCHMTQKDPHKRFTIEGYLSLHRGSTFPECFYTFLRPYFQRFACSPLLYADERIERIHRDFKLLVHKTNFPKEKENFLIVLSLITSCIRKLLLCHSKLLALDLLQRCSHITSSDIILDRLIPYILFFINDIFPIVRSQTIDCLLHCLKQVTFIPESESNIFIEYLFPYFLSLTSDRSLHVRVKFAKNICSIAQEALKFLELSKQNDSKLQESTKQNDLQIDDSHKTKDNKKENKENINKNSSTTTKNENFSTTNITITNPPSSTTFTEEYNIIIDFIQQRVAQILSDKNNNVKISLLQNNVRQLCYILGRQITNDVVFSHIITYLNDKNDWRIRAAFFKCVPEVLNFLGWQASSIISPLLLQGLNDKEDFVITAALDCFKNLLAYKCLKKSTILEISKDSIPLLSHPNEWIRDSAVSVTTRLSEHLDAVDFRCYITPMLRKFFNQEPQDFTDKMLLMYLLKKPLRKDIYQQIITHKGHQVIDPLGNPIEHVLRRLGDVTVDDLQNIKVMKKHLTNRHHVKQNETVKDELVEGVVELESGCVHVVNIDVVCSVPSGVGSFNKQSKKSKTQEINEDWKQMFSDTTSSLPPITTPIDTSSTPADVISPPLKKNLKFVKATCKKDLENLLTSVKKSQAEVRFFADPPLSSHWEPKGILVAHIHEHKTSVNRMATNKNQLFASCSNDGTLKIWNIDKIESKSSKSVMTYNKLKGQLKTLCFVGGDLVVVASDHTSLHAVDVTMSKEQSARHIDTHSQVVDVNYMENQRVTCLATAHGSLLGWDVRMDGWAWKMNTDPRLGLITSFDAHVVHPCLTLGTSSGHHCVCDVRFLLPINNFNHPFKSKVTRVVVDQSQQSLVVSSYHGNNEICWWQAESGTRQKVLWASSAPCLTNQASNRHFVNNFLLLNDRVVISGGTDMRIRFWDLQRPSSSYVISGPANQPGVMYQSKLVEATQVIQEIQKPSKKQQQSISSSSLQEADEDCLYSWHVSVAHRDVISDLAILNQSQPFIISSSRDGIIKVWK